jgi:hypothetical protein
MASERGAMFFAEQRAGRVAYVGWPPVNCQTDAQCTGINGSYCMNDKTKTAPFFCHEPIVTLVDGLARPVGCSIDSAAQKIFYTEDDQQGGDTYWPLSAVNLDGSHKSSVVPKLLDPQGIDLDTKSQKIYYTEHHGQRVGVVNYDGTGQATLHSFTGSAVFPSDIVVDAQNGFLFVQVETSLSTGGQLVRMGLDGSNPKVIVDNIVRAYGITVNPATKVAYFVSGGHGGFIGNVSYDGTDQAVVLGGLDWPFEIDIDQTMQRLVFSTTGVGDGKIQTMLFNGTDIQDVMELGFAPMGVSFGQVPITSKLPALVQAISEPVVDCRSDKTTASFSISLDNKSPKAVRVRGCQNQYACKPFQDCLVGMAPGATANVTLDASFKYMIFTYQGDARDTELYPDANMKWPTSYDIQAPKAPTVSMTAPNCPDTPANYCDCGGGDHGYRYYCRANNGFVWETNDAAPINPCPCKYPICTLHPDQLATVVPL